MNLHPNQKSWLALLRSDNFPQAGGWLMRTDRFTCVSHFCCLGILSVPLLGMEFGPDNNSEVQRIADYQSDLTDEFSSTTYAPDYAQRALGLWDNKGSFAIDDINAEWRERLIARELPAFSLANLNDRGLTFREIADFCEANAEAVFHPGWNGDVS